jgi:hypothetical protein
MGYHPYFCELLYLSHILFCFVEGTDSIDEFDPAKRAAKCIGDHLESVRELALSRDGRREASRATGIADNNAKKGLTTPLSNTSVVNVSNYCHSNTHNRKLCHCLSPQPSLSLTHTLTLCRCLIYDSLCHSHTYTQSNTMSLSLSPTLSITLSLSLSHTYTHIQTHTYTHTLTHTLTLCGCLTPHPLCSSLSHCHTYTHCVAISLHTLSVTHTYTHIQTHTYTHTRTLTDARAHILCSYLSSPRSLSLSHIHTLYRYLNPNPLCHSDILSHCVAVSLHTLSVTHSLSLSLTHTHILSISFSPSLSHTRSLPTLSVTHRQTHTHTLSLIDINHLTTSKLMITCLSFF